MRAPKVVAKGLDNIALRIREVAEQVKIALSTETEVAVALPFLTLLAPSKRST